MISYHVIHRIFQKVTWAWKNGTQTKHNLYKGLKNLQHPLPHITAFTTALDGKFTAFVTALDRKFTAVFTTIDYILL